MLGQRYLYYLMTLCSRVGLKCGEFVEQGFHTQRRLLLQHRPRGALEEVGNQPWQRFA